MLVAAVVLSPAVVRPVLRVLAAPVRRSGATGRIAVDNAGRNQRRTASTASALMLGLALVSAIGVLGASTTASTDAVIDKVLRADFIVSNPSFLSVSPQVARTLAGTDGVGAVSAVQAVRASIGGSTTQLTAVDPATITQMVDLEVVSGLDHRPRSGRSARRRHDGDQRRVPRRQHGAGHVRVRDRGR